MMWSYNLRSCNKKYFINILIKVFIGKNQNTKSIIQNNIINFFISIMLLVFNLYLIYNDISILIWRGLDEILIIYLMSCYIQTCNNKSIT